MSDDYIISVHDHGFVRLVDTMGDDDAIVQAARVSYGEGTETKSSTESLIRYLMRHRHTSPFEMCEIKLHIKCPIFIARQWVRHRTASMNEVSGRYSVLPEEMYLPEPEYLQPQSDSNKQGRSGYFSEDEARAILEEMDGVTSDAYESYTELLGSNLSRELARIVLPLSTYTEFYWKIDLHNLLHFLRLRLDEHAQKEIRDYAVAIAEIVTEWVPITWTAFEDYVLNAYTLSAGEIQRLRAEFCGEGPGTGETIPLSKREEAAFAKFMEMINQ
jgi:thymidylate synthase, flavin-dependent